MSPTYLQGPRTRPSKNLPRPRAQSRLQEKARLDVVARSPGMQRQRTLIILNTWFGWAILLPICCLSTLAFLRLFIPVMLDGSLFCSVEARWFLFGTVSWSLIYSVFGRKLMICYVFAHEWTHVLVARLFGAKIYDVKVSAKGGYVETNKSNVFISLAPYVLPFYTLLFMGLCLVMNQFIPLHQIQEIPLWHWQFPFDYTKFYFTGIGITCGFHLSYTVATLKTEQTDLLRNGESFSLILIMTLNIYLLAFLLVFASNVEANNAIATLQQTFSSAVTMLHTAVEWLATQTQSI
jgi:hypothetical protein